tara:strand:+ start:464 stop:811 length:348 start_codon:yes stop_codon:yes gene_type:complete
MSKAISRQRRATKSRSRIKLKDRHRLTVFRSSKHIYAQIFCNDGSQVLATASSNEPTFKEKSTRNIDAASEVGKMIAKRAIDKGITDVAFDRSGYKFHGRVKALADAARDGGLNF